MSNQFDISVSNDRIRSKLARKHVRSSHLSEISLHDRLLPRTYFTRFNNPPHEKVLLRYKNVKLAGKINNWSISKKGLKALPASSIQRFQEIEVSLYRLNKTAELKRIIKLLKFLRLAVLKGVMESKENSLQIFKTAMNYLPLAENKFSFGYDENDGSYTPLISSFKSRAQNNLNLYEVCKTMRKIVQYVPGFSGVRLTNNSCSNLRNLTSLKLKDVKEVSIEDFWDNIASIKTLEVLSIDVANCKTNFGNFDRFGASLLKMERLKQLSVSFYEQDDISSEWWDFLKKLQKVKDLPQRDYFVLNIKIMLAAYSDITHLDESDMMEDSKGLKRKTADKKLCKYFPAPSVSGIRINYKLYGKSHSESIIFSCNIEDGKFAVNYLETETTEYLKIQQKALSFGSKVTKLKCSQYFFDPSLNTVTFAEDFNKKARAFTKLIKFELLIEGFYSQCKIPVLGVSFLNMLTCLKVTFVLHRNEEIETETYYQSPPIKEIAQILDGKKRLKKFKFKFWGYLLELDGIDHLCTILFRLPNFERFTLDLGWERIELKQKRVLLKCLEVTNPIKIQDLDIHCVSNRNKKDVTSEIAYFKQLLQQNTEKSFEEEPKNEAEEKVQQEQAQADQMEEEDDNGDDEAEESENLVEEEGDQELDNDDIEGDDEGFEDTLEEEANDEFPYATRIFFVKDDHKTG